MRSINRLSIIALCLLALYAWCGFATSITADGLSPAIDDPTGMAPGKWQPTGEGDVPYFLPYQQAWIDDDASTALIEKSRRIGITFAEAYRSVERRIQLGSDHYFASRDFESAKLFIEDCAKFARVFGVVAEDMGVQVIDEDKDIKAHVIRFASGAKIMGLTSSPDVFRGKGGDVTLDEFAFHKNQKLVLKAANASAKVWGHQVRIISTHNGEGALFNKLVQECKTDQRDWSLHTVTLQNAVAQGLYEVISGLSARTAEERNRIRNEPDMESRREFVDGIRKDCVDETEWTEEYCCIPNSDEGAYLNYDLIDRCVRLKASDLAQVVDDLPRGKDVALYGGYDVGRKRDRSILWVVMKVGNVYRTVMLLELHKTRYAVQERILRSVLARPEFKRLCIDETGIGNMLAETLHEAHPAKVEPVTFTPTWKTTAAPYFRRWFEDSLIEIPDDDELREDLHKTRKVTTAAGNVRLTASSDEAGHADRFWAGVLMCEAARNVGGFGMSTGEEAHNERGVEEPKHFADRVRQDIEREVSIEVDAATYRESGRQTIVDIAREYSRRGKVVLSQRVYAELVRLDLEHAEDDDA